MGMGRTFVIGSWNTGGLSRMNCSLQKAGQMADIIRHEQMDIVGLCEVLDADALMTLVASLGRDWDFVWLQARPKRGFVDVDHDPNGEGYGFVWNRTRLSRISTVLLDGKEETYQPQIYGQYQVDKGRGQKELVRDPVLGRFTPQGLGGGNFELRLLLCHIRYNGIDEDKDRFFWPLRQNEFEVLTRTLLPKVEDATYGSNMPAYTMVLGDYNMNLMRAWTKKPYLEEPRDGYVFEDKVIVTVQDALTVLKKPKKGTDEKTVGYLHGFDHFSYNKNRLASMHPKVRRCDIMGDGYYAAYYGDFDRYRREISDHVPIVISLQG